MKKLLHLMLFIAAWLCADTSLAVDYVFKQGVNALQIYKDVNGTYTVQNEGVVSIETMENVFVIMHNNEVITPENVYIDSYNTRYKVDAKSGDVITITSGFSMFDRLRITEVGKDGLQIAVTNVTPKDIDSNIASGIHTPTYFNWSRAGEVTVQFNTSIICNTVTMNCNGKSYPVMDVNIRDQFLSFNLNDAFTQAYFDGLAKDMEIEIVISGISELNDRTRLFNKDGILKLRYIATDEQGTLKESSIAGMTINEGVSTYKFMSFYDPSSEADGIFRFTFSKEVGSYNSIVLTMGDLDQSASGKYYTESIAKDKVKIDGNTIIVDVRGKMRSLARMFPTVNMEDEGSNERFSVEFDHITLSLNNIQDKSGNTMRSNGQGTIGSYSYTFPYEEIKDDIVMDADEEHPDYEKMKDGSLIIGGEYIQLWIDQQVKSLDGVKIVIKVDNGAAPDPETGIVPLASGEVKISKEDIQIISNDASGTVVGFYIPTLIASVQEDGETETPQMKDYTPVPGSEVRVYLQVTTTNGMPHDLLIKYIYNGDVTGISSVTTDCPTLSTATFNLAGQKVSPSTKGITITNGKKFLNK